MLSKPVSPTSQITILSSTIVPGTTLPAVVSQCVPPPMVQPGSALGGASKPVPSRASAPSEQLLSLTNSLQHELPSLGGQTENRLVPLATLMPIGQRASPWV